MKHIAMIALLGLASTAAFAEVDGEKVAQAKGCYACHGDKGHSTIEANPILAGQYHNYLEHALTEYKEDKRKNAIMNGQAAGLSKEEIHALAMFFGSQDSTLYTPSEHGDLKK